VSYPEKIIALRRFLGYSQARLASALMLTPKAIYQYEKGNRKPEPIVCLKLAALARPNEAYADFFFRLSGLERDQFVELLGIYTNDEKKLRQKQEKPGQLNSNIALSMFSDLNWTKAEVEVFQQVLLILRRGTRANVKFLQTVLRELLDKIDLQRGRLDDTDLLERYDKRLAELEPYIMGVSLTEAARGKPEIGRVVYKINRQLALGKRALAVRTIKKHLGHLPQLGQILQKIEDEDRLNPPE
jgi:DNA-binding XRE family transcriptional regulator